MMENRSFDHLLGAMPGAPALTGVNRLDNVDYRQTPLPKTGPFDLLIDGQQAFCPKHEFANVAVQLGWQNGAPTLSGFAQDAANTLQQDNHLTGSAAKPWIQKVMDYVPFGDTPEQDPLPALHTLAREFTVCDRWFSSIPGPTWPNRFFALMGSCHGRVKMPEQWEDTGSAIVTFLKQACKESIFSLMADNGKSSALFADCDTPLAYMVKDSGPRQTIREFEQAASDGTLPAFSWIEPSYGLLGTDGNSQHPPEDLRYGDQFIARIFNALTQNDDAWKKTLFVLVYDEHGGFYDHMVPPTTEAPDDIQADVDLDGKPFDFTRLGLRVPAILASPWIKQGIDSQLYDHTSMLAFLCDLFGMDRNALGRRVAQSVHFGSANIWNTAPRTDKVTLTTVLAPPRPAILRKIETELGSEARKLIQGVHSYLTGGSVDDAVEAVPDNTRGLEYPQLPGSKLLGAMAERAVQLLQAAGVPPGFDGGGGVGRAAAAPLAPNASSAPNAPNAPNAAATRSRVLCIHGVGHGDAVDGWRADPGWQTVWEQITRAQLAANGIDTANIQVDFLQYDDLFGSGPSLAQIARGLGTLLEGLVPLDRGFNRDLHLPQVTQAVRWTAGMTIQWLEDEALRAQLRQALLAKLSGPDKPDIVLAHSLGSLISYDTFRRAVAAKDFAPLEGVSLVTFGSQIAHPIVINDAWGGKPAPLHDDTGHGIAHWFHLYNRCDKVFTRPLTFPDPARTSLDTPFGDNVAGLLFSLDHDPSGYLQHKQTVEVMWPALARHQQLSRSLPAVTLASHRARAMTATKRRALLVGINNYPDASMRLHGCTNDVYLMSRTLQESGYAAANIRLLVDDRATRDNLVEHLQWLVADTRPGDERVFFYSGHGTQIPVYGFGGFPDHMCESLVPYDFSWDDEQTHFTDKEFRRFYTHLPFGRKDGDARLIAVFDCCHAAGMTRAGSLVRSIAMPPDIRHRMSRWNAQTQSWQERSFAVSAGQARPFSAEGGSKPHQRLQGHGTAAGLRSLTPARQQEAQAALGHHGPYMPLLLYAAKQSQLASECEVGTQSYGAFTHALVEQLKRPADGPVHSFEDLIRKTRTYLQQANYAQTPELVGPRNLRQTPCSW